MRTMRLKALIAAEYVARLDTNLWFRCQFVGVILEFQTYLLGNAGVVASVRMY